MCPRSGHGQGGRVIRGLCARGTDTNTPSSLPSSDAPGGVLSDSKIRRGASVTEINIIGDTVSMEREKLLFYLKKKIPLFQNSKTFTTHKVTPNFPLILYFKSCDFYLKSDPEVQIHTKLS